MKTFGRESGFTILETLLVVGVIGIVAGIAVPMFGTSIAGFRLSGDARSISNAVAVAKMRASSKFSRVRVYVALGDKSFRMETWDKAASHWEVEGGSTNLSLNTIFGHGVVASPPPNTQGAIAQAAMCKDDDGDDIGGTACIIFNSRGVPVDSTGAPTGANALYVTDGTAVYGLTVAATGMARLWRTNPSATPSWVLQ
jgi:Tfp pilus assembly protein FimT